MADAWQSWAEGLDGQLLKELQSLKQRVVLIVVFAIIQGVASIFAISFWPSLVVCSALIGIILFGIATERRLSHNLFLGLTLVGNALLYAWLLALAATAAHIAAYSLFGLCFIGACFAHGQQFHASVRAPWVVGTSLLPVLAAVAFAFVTSPSSEWPYGVITAAIGAVGLMFMGSAGTAAASIARTKRSQERERTAMVAQHTAIATASELGQRVHDLKNQFTPLAMNLEYLRNLEGQALLDAWSEVRGELFVAVQDIGDDMRTLMQVHSYVRRPASLSAALEKLKTLNKPDKSFFVDVDDHDLLVFMANGEEGLRSLLMNVGTNSLEAGAKRLRIEVLVDDENCHIVATDDGPGFSQELISRGPTPYLTTKKTGTGLGLVTIQALLQASGGRWSLRNVSPRGAQVRVQLPFTLPGLDDDDQHRPVNETKDASPDEPTEPTPHVVPIRTLG